LNVSLTLAVRAGSRYSVVELPETISTGIGVESRSQKTQDAAASSHEMTISVEVTL
jgi:hypothetical protein